MEGFVEVGVLGYKTAKAPDILVATLGPCIGVGAIYEKKGYLLHTIADNGVLPDDLKVIIGDLERDVKDKSKLKIYVAGGSLDGKYDENQLEGRRMVLDSLTEAGFKDSIEKVQWGKFDSVQTLYLNLAEEEAGIDEGENNFNYFNSLLSA